MGDGHSYSDENIGVSPKWSRMQWIQRIWKITEAWIGLNLRILSVTCVSVVQWYHLCLLPVADPGFGQGGAQKFCPRFCQCSEAKSGEGSELYNIGGCPGPALGPWKLLHFKLSNMHSPTFPGTFCSIFQLHFVWVHYKISISIWKILAILTNAISIFFIWDNQGY